MTHWGTKIVVPVGAVEAVTLIEKHGVGDIGQVVVSTGTFDAAFHFGVFDFVPNAVLASWGGGKFA